MLEPSTDTDERLTGLESTAVSSAPAAADRSVPRSHAAHATAAADAASGTTVAHAEMRMPRPGTMAAAPSDTATPDDAHDLHDAHTSHNAHAAHNAHAGHSVAMFRDKFWISLLLTVPALIWGHMLQSAFGYTAPVFSGSRFIPALFGSAVFLYGGPPFLKGAIGEIKDRLPGMMTLIALAISVAFGFSVAVLFGFPGMPLWEELASLVTIMLLGHWIEMRSVSQAQGALGELAKLLPDTAVRAIGTGAGERLEDVRVSALATGDIVLVRPGASIPADGVVQSGESAINESLVTGESAPVTKSSGAKVIAGSVNGAGSLRVVVAATGDHTALAGIMRLVDEAQQSKSRAQALADRAAFWLTGIALGSGILTFVVWLAMGAGLAVAVERLVTVLVIACPHALGLAVPLVLAISTTLGARNGLLIRDRRGFENARHLTTVVFDKTGTLTVGAFRVVDTKAIAGLDAHEALRLAAAVERDAEHPVARAIVASAQDAKLTVPVATGFATIPGQGARATVESRALSAGGPNLLTAMHVTPSSELAAFAAAASARGEGVIYLIEHDAAVAAFAVADAVRPESAAAVAALRTLSVDVVMMTGDAKAVADAVGTQLGITTVFSQVLPADKASRIAQLQQAGKRVAMVGDGVNDAPALAAADVGIAVGAGTDVAIEAGAVVLVRSDPRDVPRIIALSRASYRKMLQNLWWAAGYNIIAIPLAAGVLAPWGIVLTPAMGAALMSVSTVVVALNAQLLRRMTW